MPKNGKKNIPTVDAVADYFLTKALISEEAITNLKMQRLVYYAQAHSLAQHGKPLFADEPEAGARGPVYPNLYRRFRRHGWPALDPHKQKTDPLGEFNKEEIALLDQVWERYSRLSGVELACKTYAETPWKEAYGDRPPGSQCSEVISHKNMRDYYKKQLSVE